MKSNIHHLKNYKMIYHIHFFKMLKTSIVLYSIVIVIDLTSVVQSVDGIIQQMTPTKRATTFHCPICQIEMFTLKEMMSHIEKCTSASTTTYQEQSQQSSQSQQQTPPPPTQKPPKPSTSSQNAVLIEENDDNDEYDGESVVYSQLYPNNNKSNRNTQNDDFPTYSLDLQPPQSLPNNNNPESETTQTPTSSPPKQQQQQQLESNNNLVFTSASTVNSLVKRQLFNTNDNSTSSSSNDAFSEDENNKYIQSPPIKTKSQQILSNNNLTPLMNKSFTIPITSPQSSSSTKTTPNKTLKRSKKKNKKINSQLTTSPPSPSKNNNNSSLASSIHNQNMNISQLSTQSTMINISTPSPPPAINRQPTIIESSPNSYTQQPQPHVNYSMPLNFFLVPPSMKRRKLDGCETQKITREYKDYDENGNEVDIEEYIEIKIVRKIKQPN